MESSVITLVGLFAFGFLTVVFFDHMPKILSIVILILCFLALNKPKLLGSYIAEVHEGFNMQKQDNKMRELKRKDNGKPNQEK